MQSARHFTQANAILASQGLRASREMTAQGSWADIVLRFAARKLGQLLNVEGAQISLLYVADGAEHATRQIEAQQIFSAANAALAGQGLTSHYQLIVEGNPADEILRLADKMGADLIAMGSHGRTGVLRLLMGSVSRKVLDQARCPVLIVRIPDEEMAKAGLIEMSGVN